MRIASHRIPEGMILTATAVAVLSCSGCALFLPHKPCLVYTGDIQNAHGFGELGRGGILYPSGSATYVFDPELEVWSDAGPGLIFTVPGDTKAGITLVIECQKPGPKIATRSTADGTLRAWMVRDREYPGRTTTPDALTDYQPLVIAIHKGNVPTLAGVYPLVGTVQIRALHGLAKHWGIDYLAFHLNTSGPVPPDKDWLLSTDAGDSEAAGRALRQGRLAQPGIAKIGGEFQIRQCFTKEPNVDAE